MRPCLFLVPDKNIEKMICGFLSRTGWYQSLGCSPFAFDPRIDLIVDPGRDPGIYKRADALLLPYASSHEHAVVMVDAAWAGSPGSEAIREKVQQHITKAGWPGDTGCAIVLDPEVEVWVWQHTPHVLAALGVTKDYEALQQELQEKNCWTPGASKPHAPKEAVEYVLRKAKKPRSAAIYEQIAGQVTLRKCNDPALQQIQHCLQRWYPAT